MFAPLLFRLRDQIKVWLAAPEVKDKGQLEEARKRIEKEMEKFKTCEKMFKIKAFSKEGLAQERKVNEWINECECYVSLFWRDILDIYLLNVLFIKFLSICLFSQLGPGEAEREKHRKWIRDSLDRLNTEIDSHEAEIEKHRNQQKKGRIKGMGEFVESDWLLVIHLNGESFSFVFCLIYSLPHNCCSICVVRSFCLF